MMEDPPSRSPPTAPTARVAACDTYDQLRQHVKHLKGEQRQRSRHQDMDRQAESAALLLQRQQFATQLAAAQQEAAALQHRLQESLDRSAKARQQHEKQHRAWATQLARLQEGLDEQRKRHQAELAILNEKNMKQTEEWDSQVAALERSREEEREAMAAASAARVAEAEKWSRGEMQAVRAEAEDQLEAARADTASQSAKVAELQQQVQELRACTERQQRESQGLCEALQGQSEHTARLKEQLRRAHDARESEAVKTTHQAADLELRMGVLRQQHTLQVHELEARHVLEMDRVQQRLAAVLTNKDATIGGLRAQLAAAVAHAAAVEEVMRVQGRELMAADDAAPPQGLGSGVAAKGSGDMKSAAG